MLARYLSEIRTGCANERSSGSVRGAPGNWCPYRDRQLSQCPIIVSAKGLKFLLNLLLSFFPCCFLLIR